jgi:TolB-like protein
MDQTGPKALFLSYASQDVEAARRLAVALRGFGIEVWFDQSELRGGDAWDQKIRRQIKNCALFVPVISAHTEERAEGYFRLEWKLADERTHLMAKGLPFLLPVAVDPTGDGAAMVPESFRAVHWIRLPGGAPTPEFVAHVKQMLEASRRPVAGGHGPEGTERKSQDRRWTKPAVPASRSIVVLPFDNISPDPSDAYLGDGLAEELTAKLSKLGSLRVISRNSAMALKGTKKDTRAIARELDVQYLLEGSVRKAGTALRITAQLIDGERDQHLWAETYSGSVEDVFGMQEQVSRAIVDALRVELNPEEAKRLDERPFQNFKTYQFYAQVRADAFLASEPALDRALETTELGLATVGENELLLAARGLVLFQYVNTMLKSPHRHAGFLEEANRCADRALTLNPASAPSRMVKALVLWAKGDVAGAVAQGTRALALDPNNPDALLILGYWRSAGGWDPEGAHDLLSKVERVDPLIPMNRGAMAWAHWFDGDFQGALDGLDPYWQASDKGNPWRVFRAYLQAGAGDIAGAERTVDDLRAHAPQHLLTSLGVFLKHAWRGEKAAALAAVTLDLETAACWDDVWPLFLAAGYARIGEADRAFRWLDHAVGQGITNVPYLDERDPFLDSLRGNSRFVGILEKAARLAERAAAAAAAASSSPLTPASLWTSV